MRMLPARRRLSIAVIVSLALVAEVLVALPAEAAEVPTRPVTSLPALPSDEVDVATPTVPTGTVDAPPLVYPEAPAAPADPGASTPSPTDTGAAPAVDDAFDQGTAHLVDQSQFQDTYAKRQRG